MTREMKQQLIESLAETRRWLLRLHGNYRDSETTAEIVAVLKRGREALAKARKTSP